MESLPVMELYIQHEIANTVSSSNVDDAAHVYKMSAFMLFYYSQLQVFPRDIAIQLRNSLPRTS